MKNPTRIRTLIIDDDAFSREQLSDLLSASHGSVDICGLCDSATSGLEAIIRQRPELVFLDIEMPDMSGFDMLKQLSDIDFEVIFTTAYDQYAIKAIRFAALDYLLKPIEPAQLRDAIEKAADKIEQRIVPPQFRQLLAQVEGINRSLENLAIPTMEGLLFIPLSEIVRCESDGKYTKVILADKRLVLASRTLGEFEELLENSDFIRVHNSHLINLKHISRYIKGVGGQVVMRDGSSVDVARRKKEELLQRVSQFK